MADGMKFKRTSNLLRQIFNVRAWVDFDRVKGVTFYLINGAKKLFVPNLNAPTVSFDEVVSRLGLTEPFLKKQYQSFRRLVWILSIFSLGAFTYMLYLLSLKAWHAALLAVVVAGIALALSFRYHYLAYQIQQRKLGTPLKEWFHKGLMGEKS